MQRAFGKERVPGCKEDQLVIDEVFHELIRYSSAVANPDWSAQRTSEVAPS